jgi:hypothetical protein
MPIRLFLVFLVAVHAGLRAQTGQSLSGRIDGTRYYSANGTFNVEVPVLSELGGRIIDTTNVVTFEDSFDTHISIACFTLDVTQKWELATRGRKDYLTYFFTSFVLPEFSNRHDGVAVETTQYEAALQGGSLTVFALLPGGSFFSGRNSLVEGVSDGSEVAKRGIQLFVRQDKVFVITTELAERVTQRSTYRKTPDEENRLLRDRLAGVAGMMRFPVPADSAKRASGGTHPDS